MKLLVISDIHSNIDGLEALWQNVQGADEIWCIGDVVDYGPFPAEVIDWLQEKQAVCVRGNHDEKVCKAYRRKETGSDVALLSWAEHNAGQLQERHVRYLEGLPWYRVMERDGCRYGLSHMYERYTYHELQSLYQYRRFWHEELGSPQDPSQQSCLLFGHTHRLGVHWLSATERWLNPGSVSYRRPDDPDKTAHGIVITEGQPVMHRVPYDRRRLWQVTEAIPLQGPERDVAQVFFQEKGW